MVKDIFGNVNYAGCGSIVIGMRNLKESLESHDQKKGAWRMTHEHLFSIEWDCSYGDPDYAVSGICVTRINNMGSLDRERLAKMLEWLAMAIRNQTVPFEIRDRGYLKGDLAP